MQKDIKHELKVYGFRCWHECGSYDHPYNFDEQLENKINEFYQMYTLGYISEHDAHEEIRRFVVTKYNNIYFMEA